MSLSMWQRFYGVTKCFNEIQFYWFQVPEKNNQLRFNFSLIKFHYYYNLCRKSKINTRIKIKEAIHGSITV